MGLVNIVSTSDWHIGLPRVAPDVIPTIIRNNLFPILKSGDIDILNIVGDVTDGHFEVGGANNIEALRLIDEIMSLSIKHDFYVRILQGTFTHDRNQSKLFNFRKGKIPKLNGVERVRFFDDVDIECIEPLGITILYKPDDLPHKDINTRLVELVEEVGQPVDVFLNHGYFEHLLPRGMPHRIPNTLTAKGIEKFVAGIVFNGHIHTPSIYRKVINHGSIDRLAHGEEEPKGFFRVSYNTETKKATHKFIETVGTTVYNTYDVSRYENKDRPNCGDAVERCKALVRGWIKDLQAAQVSVSKDVFVRVAHMHPPVKHAIMAMVLNEFSNVILSFKNVLETEEELPLEADLELDSLPKITPNNICGMVSEFLNKRGRKLEMGFIKEHISQEVV